jgi:hypothetical protein
MGWTIIFDDLEILLIDSDVFPGLDTRDWGDVSDTVRSPVDAWHEPVACLVSGSCGVVGSGGGE